MRLFTILFTVLVLAGCGAPTTETAPSPPPTAPEPTASASPEPPATTTISSRTPEPMIDPTDDQLSAIRTDYQRIEAARVAGSLKKDSLLYNCEYAMTEGTIYLYTNDSGLVLATHQRNDGSHGGTTEQYYFRDGKLVFYFEQSGYWQFGGEMKVHPDGSETPGTIDYITEERRYYANGKIIKALAKSYNYENYEDRVAKAGAARNEPLSVTGSPAGKALLDAAIATRKVDCGLVTKLVEG